MVLEQLLPVCDHDFYYPHEAWRDFLAVIKILEELLNCLDAGARLLDFEDDVEGSSLAVSTCDFDFSLGVVEQELSNLLPRVLIHDLIFALHRELEDILNFRESFSEVAAINEPTIECSLTLHLIELVEKS